MQRCILQNVLLFEIMSRHCNLSRFSLIKVFWAFRRFNKKFSGIFSIKMSEFWNISIILPYIKNSSYKNKISTFLKIKQTLIKILQFPKNVAYKFKLSSYNMTNWLSTHQPQIICTPQFFVSENRANIQFTRKIIFFFNQYTKYKS